MNLLSALTPRTTGGCQFLVYGDCCIGPPEPGRDHEKHLAALHGVLGRLSPAPEFVCFVGDMIWGLTRDHRPNGDREALRAEWERALTREMRPLLDLKVPVYPVPGNHDTFNAASEAAWRDTFPNLPANGPPGQEGLTYFVRRGDVLIVALNVYATALGAPSTVFGGRADVRWLDRVLAGHADARHKLVLGHTPVFPVNGYTARHWRMGPEFAEAFWEVLVRRGVTAYLTSHVIAFDVQVHRGVLQVTTGGAGTVYGPGGCMPAPPEYHHLAQVAVDDTGLRCQAVDEEGRARESFAWPARPGDGRFWRLRADRGGEGPARALWTGGSPGEPFPRVRVSLDGVGAPRLTVALYDPREVYPRVWTGPEVAGDGPLDVTVGICPGMGPGGVLARLGDGPFSSLTSDAATGYTAEGWPDRWEAGAGVAVEEA